MRMEVQHPVSHVFRRHAEALFGGTAQLPTCIAEQEASLAGAVEAAGLGDRLCHLLSGLRDVRARRDEPFELFILGEGKFGKSTLVNALLGRSIAPTDYLPKTWCFNRYVAVPDPPAHVRIFVSDELLKSQGCDHLEASLGAPAGAYRGLREYHLDSAAAAQIAAEEERRVVGTLNRPDAYWSPIMEMEWSVPASGAILPGIRIVDTMGINQIAAPRAHLHHLKWQYERADAVLWLVTADRIGSGETREQIMEARRYSKVVYVLITRWDKVANKPEALERAMAHYGDLSTAVIPVSALAALAARGCMPQTPTTAEREFLARYRRLSPEQLYALSGFEALGRQLERFLDGHQTVTRHMQVYSALRQKDRELRRVAEQARADAEHNIRLHDELVEATERAAENSRDRVAKHLRHACKEWIAEIKDGLRDIRYENRGEARSLIGADRIASEFQAAQSRLAEMCSEEFAEVIRAAAEPDNRYRASEFAPTGAVAEVSLTAGSTTLRVEVKTVKVELSIKDPTGLGTIFMDLLSQVPIFGPLLEMLFPGLVQRLKDEAMDKFRKQARETLVPELRTKTEQVRCAFVDAIEEKRLALLADVHGQYAKTGGEPAQEATIHRIDRVLSRRIVEPLFVSIPVRMMRRLHWRS
jgi:hypothetical protein